MTLFMRTTSAVCLSVCLQLLSDVPAIWKGDSRALVIPIKVALHVFAANCLFQYLDSFAN